MFDPFTSPRSYTIRNGEYVCPQCLTGAIYCVQDCDGSYKDVCSNHKDGDVYLLDGNRTCKFVYVITTKNEGMNK